MKSVLACCCLAVLAIGGCAVIDPAEEIPSYIRINNVTLTTTSAEGSNSHAVSDVWIYIDGELLGGYELPCTVPVLKEGTHEVLVRAGIRQNGMSTLRAIYPFYKGWEGAIQLTKGSATEIAPAFEYYPLTDFLCQEEFGGTGTSIQFQPAIASIGTFTESFEGASAHITLNGTSASCRAFTSSEFYLDAGDEIYAELNYRNSAPFDVGLSYVDASNVTIFIPWLRIETSQSWNKIYIRLKDALMGQPLNVPYRLEMRFEHDAPSGESHFWLDNIKWIN